MREYLRDFFEWFDYPQEARGALLDAYDAIAAHEGARFSELLSRYEADINSDMNRMIEEAGQISESAGVHEYTGELLLFICMSRTLLEYYRREGIAEEIFYTSMCDLKYKLIECWLVYGIWGSFVSSWFPGFFRLTRFGFGKLQFEIVLFGRHYEKNGVRLLPESRAINIHIPRTGGRLDGESLKKSYDQAAAFFKRRYRLEKAVFVCSSWLLYPRNLEVLGEGSNLRRFILGFDLVDHGEYKDYDAVWRLFDRKYTGDVDELPQDSSFRRAYADWIRRGIKTGWGRGVYIYDSDSPDGINAQIFI